MELIPVDAPLCVADGTSVLSTDPRISVITTDGLLFLRGPPDDTGRCDDAGGGEERRGDGSGGRGAGADRPAPNERADRRCAVHLQPHSGDPRVRPAAE